MKDEHQFEEQRIVSDRRRSIADRRASLDRRRGPGKRRSDIRKSAEEGQLTDEQFEFLIAIDEYKKKNNRPFPTWTEVLELIKALGYRKVADPHSLDTDMHDPVQDEAVNSQQGHSDILQVNPL